MTRIDPTQRGEGEPLAVPFYPPAQYRLPATGRLLRRDGLGKCPDCNQKISLNAEWCVRCGRRPELLHEIKCKDCDGTGTIRWPAETCWRCWGEGTVFYWDWPE